MKRNKIWDMKIIVFIIVVLSVLIIGLGLYNFFNNPEFFNTSVMPIITILVAIYVSFYMSQRVTDKRKIKDTIERVLDRIDLEIKDPNFVTIDTSTTTESINMRNRIVNNKISILKEIDLEDNTHVQRISQLFNEYEEFIGNHINDKTYLSKSEMDLKRPLSLISDEIDRIRVDLYK